MEARRDDVTLCQLTLVTTNVKFPLYNNNYTVNVRSWDCGYLYTYCILHTGVLRTFSHSIQPTFHGVLCCGMRFKWPLHPVEVLAATFLSTLTVSNHILESIQQKTALRGNIDYS